MAPPEPLTHRDFYERLEAISGWALVVLTSPGCGACRRVKAELSRLALTPPLPLFEVDVAVSPGVAQALEVFHLPAMFLYVDGEFHAPIHAEARAPALEAAILAAAVESAHEEP